MWDRQGLESNKVCLIGDGFSFGSLAPLSGGSELQTWGSRATPPSRGGRFKGLGGCGSGARLLGLREFAQKAVKKSSEDNMPLVELVSVLLIRDLLAKRLITHLSVGGLV